MFFAAASAFMIASSAARLGTDAGTVYFVSRLRAPRPAGPDRRHRLAGLLPVLAVGGAVRRGWLTARRSPS